ncbi:MAG: DUF1963 domain-containing protein [Neomegalonema sp.]
MKISLDDYVAANTRPGLLLQRRAPTFDDRLSYLGGRPMLPPGTPWPRNPDGLAMPFLAQLDLGVAPQSVSSVAPKDGVLHFFFDPRCDYEGNVRTSVLYTPAHQLSTRTPLDPPPDAPTIGGEHVYGGHAYGYESEAGRIFPIQSFPKSEFDFVSCETLRAPACEEWGSLDFDPDDDLQLKRSQIIEEALVQAYGAEVRESADAATDGYRPILDPGNICDIAWYTSEPSEIGPLYQNWPHCWLTVGLHLAPFSYDKDSRWRQATDQAIRQPFLDEVHDWVKRFKDKPPFAPLSVWEKSAYRQWVQDRFQRHYHAWRNQPSPEAAPARPQRRASVRERLFGPKPKPLAETQTAVHDGLLKDNATKQTHYAIWSELRYLKSSTLDALSLCQSAAQPDRRALTQEMMPHFKPYYTRGPADAHQVFGYGENVQNAGADNADKVMLLQLTTDYDMLWMWADCGVLQFWIETSDLANRRFDNVLVTLEGG